MTNENKQKQIELLSKLIDEITKVKNEMFEIGQAQTIGMTPSELNEFYKSNHEKTDEALYNAMSIIAQRHYELNQIKDIEL